jgi:hypothetical protein
VKNFTLIYVASIIGLTPPLFAAEVQFDDVIKNPSRFNHQRVTVTGLAEVQGDTFDLWRDARACKEVDNKHYMFVAQHFPAGARRNPCEYANLHFVKVTGFIETSIHGHLGMDPCSLVLEHVEVLPGPRLKQFLPILGFFRNETVKKINLRAYWRGHDGTSSFGIPPGNIDCFAIEKGRVEATTVNDKTFAQCELIPPRLIDQFYDRQTKAYYFRISENRIEPVLPQNARGWNRGYMSGRD